MTMAQLKARTSETTLAHEAAMKIREVLDAAREGWTALDEDGRQHGDADEFEAAVLELVAEEV